TRVLDALLSRALRLPGARRPYTVRRDVPVPARDGVDLLTDHYVPAAPARGTILVRTPYGRGFPGDLLDARAYAARGHHVLVQSCRGTFGSGGRFEPMAREADDAQDAVAWLRAQPWFDGRLATVGASYLGWTQWALLKDPPPELRTAVILVGPHDMSEAVYGSGAFTLNDFLSWSDLIVHQERTRGVAGLRRLVTAKRRLAPAFTGLPLADAAETVLGGQAPWFRDWLAHPDRGDGFWDRLRLRDAVQRTGVPVRLVGGWQDLFLRQTLEQYAVLRDRGVDVDLTVGPWSHLELATKAAGSIARGNLAWFAEHLAGEPASRRCPVRVHVTGGGRWRELPEWPPPTVEQVHHLQPGGRLTPGEPTGAGPSTSWWYDPADPTPTVGGRLLTGDAGMRDNRELEARPDVVTFTSAPLAADLEILGTPVAELALSRDNPHADVFVRLCDVDPAGRSTNFSEALLRLDPGAPAGRVQRVQVPLDPCAHRLAAGHRLRVQLSGGSHPRFARNLGTGEPPASGTGLVPCTHTVHHGAAGVSRLVLPVRPTPIR
ncbi:MAG TPA: CocE/NonD family hydrolase, partial [Pseudonocardia sp.]|nr:CocE/NonD family hydrolase [Pseudonocardia sp.]